MHYLDFLSDVLKNSVTITCLVMVMLLLIEFVNVRSSGRIVAKLSDKSWLQVIFAALIGLIPGCLGGFTVVSLYSQRLLSFGALVAGMISTFGDEAFVIFAYSPKWTLLLSAALVVVGVVTGLLTDFFNRHEVPVAADECEYHNAHDHHHADGTVEARLSWVNCRSISVARIAIAGALLLYITAILTGVLSHEHGSMPDLNNYSSAPALHEAHSHSHHHGLCSWENIVFGLLALLTLAVVLFSPARFVESHLWAHVVKKHFLSVFLWTFGVLLFLKLLYNFVDVNGLIASHESIMILLLLIAVAVGIVPESGPHLIFVVMFFSGAIPFSILLANSVVQDGHGALPLLAESRGKFLLMKAINIVAGLVVGFSGLLLGF